MRLLQLRQLEVPLCVKSKKNLLVIKISPVVTDAGEDTLANDTKSKKCIIGSQPRGTHNVFPHYPKDPNCEFYKKTSLRRFILPSQKLEIIYTDNSK